MYTFTVLTEFLYVPPLFLSLLGLSQDCTRKERGWPDWPVLCVKTTSGLREVNLVMLALSLQEYTWEMANVCSPDPANCRAALWSPEQPWVFCSCVKGKVLPSYHTNHTPALLNNVPCEFLAPWNFKTHEFRSAAKIRDDIGKTVYHFLRSHFVHGNKPVTPSFN